MPLYTLFLVLKDKNICNDHYLYRSFSAWRRFQAAAWLESLVGPLGISSHPTEKEFVSRLRNGLILCNAINKVHPGAVPKVTI